MHRGPQIARVFLKVMRSLAVSCFGFAFFAGPFPRAQTASPPPLLLGTAWYPEQWPESRWEADLTLMQQAGIHMVRVGEFAGSRMEPGDDE